MSKLIISEYLHMNSLPNMHTNALLIFNLVDLDISKHVVENIEVQKERVIIIQNSEKLIKL